MKYPVLILLISLALAFTVMPCNAPMKKIGLRCCLDDDDNNQCDLDESTTSTKGDCERPYIFSGDGCCLDANRNDICDKLESSAKITTIPKLSIRDTTSSSSTSTTITTTTTSSSTTTTTSSTTTTVSALVMANVTGCYDSDNGEDLDLYGETAGPARAGGDIVLKKDRCITNDTLMEYRCQKGRVYGRESLCGSSELCIQGECCLPEGAACKQAPDCCSGECRKRLAVRICT